MDSLIKDRIMTVEEAADFLRIKKDTLYQMKSEHRVPYRKIGGKLVFLESELWDWIKSGESESKCQ